MSELLSTDEAAAILGVTKGSFSNALRGWNLHARERRGSSSFFDPNDVERVRAMREEKKHNAPPRKPSKPRKPKEPIELNEKQQDWGSGKRGNGTLTASEKAVVYAAWLRGTLGAESQWRHTEPPASFKRCWEAHEAARDDAAEWERAA